MEDRRVFARTEAKIPLAFLVTNSGREGTAKTIDVSANGLGIVAEESLPVQAELEMWLNIPDHHEALHVKGVIIWSKEISGSAQQRLGVALQKPDLIALARTLWIKQKCNIYS